MVQSVMDVVVLFVTQRNMLIAVYKQYTFATAYGNVNAQFAPAACLPAISGYEPPARLVAMWTG
jgi:hypothetical protein